MAFENLTDLQQEGIAAAWDELAAMVRAAEEFEAACKEAGAGSLSAPMDQAMIGLSAAMRNGYGPTVLSGTAAGYFDAHCEGDAGDQAELAKRLADGLIADQAALHRALSSARDVLQGRADELARLADMADGALDAFA